MQHLPHIKTTMPIRRSHPFHLLDIHRQVLDWGDPRRINLQRGRQDRVHSLLAVAELVVQIQDIDVVVDEEPELVCRLAALIVIEAFLARFARFDARVEEARRVVVEGLDAHGAAGDGVGGQLPDHESDLCREFAEEGEGFHVTSGG